MKVTQELQECQIWHKQLLRITGGGVPPGSPNADPISDQNMAFSTPVFRPDL